MTGVRGVVVALLVALALVLQVSLFPHLAFRGVGPDLVLLVVVAVTIATDERFGMVTGFAAGLLLDLAPPADHVAGRWALALLLVGLLVGRFTRDTSEGGPSPTGTMAIAAGAAFVGSSVFALTGLVMSDPAAGVGEMLGAVALSVAWDVVLTPLVVPGVLLVLRRLEPERVLA